LGRKKTTVKLKIFADNNICENNICDHKITLFLAQDGHFTYAKIFTANIFIRNFSFYWGNDGKVFSGKFD
jgi:hypothetical protein